jgi:molybdopterin molybdotransferase
VDELFWRARIRPGGPVFCGRRGNTWVFGLPGNPLSTVVCYLVFVAPLLRMMGGEAGAIAATTSVRLAQDVTGPGDRTTYATARLREDGAAVLTEKQGSHMTKALADADGFVIIPHDRVDFAAGEELGFLPLPG